MNDKNLIKEALNKNKECCYMLAEKYYYGKGVPADRRLAKEWYEASAKMGHVSAQYMYGYILCASARGEEDLKKGIKYVKKAAGRPVFAALGAGIAMSGSLLGPLLFFSEILFRSLLR